MRRYELINVIYESSELLAVNKPAGLVCHPTKHGIYSSLISRMRLYLAAGAHPQLVNRLDRETSGVTLAALTDGAARELRRLWDARDVRKEYLAILCGHLHENQGVIEAPLGKDLHSAVAIKDCVQPGGASASTEYTVLRRFRRALPNGVQMDATLVHVVPRTGRKHQIRIHFAHLGHHIVGDKLYGPDEDLYLALVQNRLTEEQRQQLVLPYHALHACCISFSWRDELRRFEADPEPWFSEFALGGSTPGATHPPEPRPRQGWRALLQAPEQKLP